MRTVSVVGIGAGNPEHITVQAISTLNAVDAVFLMDKGDAARELTELRRTICQRYITSFVLPGELGEHDHGSPESAASRPWRPSTRPA